MARPKSIRAPTTASLPNNLRIPSATPSLIKSFGRLSRQALLDLVFQWLDDRNARSFPPYLERDEPENADDDELSPYPAAKTIEDVRTAYQDLQDRKGGKREVIDRILEGDWRHGITLRQLAMVDLRYMEDHPASLRWTAFELTRIGVDGARSTISQPDTSACIPRIHAATFLSNLQQQISPLVKAHYHLTRSSTLPLTFLRIFVTTSPYQSPRQPPDALLDSARVMYVAFPDSCPFIYTSIAAAAASGTKPPAAAHAAATDPRSLQRIVRDAVPKALSRPHARYALAATSLAAKSLPALLALRGHGRSNAANGAFSIFADAVLEGSPLDPRPSQTVSPAEHFRQDADADTGGGQENDVPTKGESPATHATKKRKLAVHARFGTTGTLSSAPLDRLDVRLLDRVAGAVDADADADADAGPNADAETDDSTQPTLSLTFSGVDVVAGLRRLADLGVVNAERMPSWMTGEEAVSVAVVRRGKRVVRDGG
ncbi:CENP-N/CHL4 family protein [Aspergillus clavatus NRRL 1]|uniref:CHL4 family chromosome segregation protein, putative n=1 Tax=Aspergillus clavatus (strain ATCC 1007 / CBS 513.65 / DSM 816 / NCTC 3887 / NRRL 1 / QM 1276 / 107) TaxID=344612 RepID=A1CGW4_ASPCL|nr:CHL4 family chromosome segregation protein, putative [Aspergillus clavatus NRRL 1]EAW10119.1 CHL4 family chromosome segregation protein, putative [Aspergillus clavatus NRRL 1]